MNIWLAIFAVSIPFLVYFGYMIIMIIIEAIQDYRGRQ
jgi:hypothetical protein